MQREDREFPVPWNPSCTSLSLGLFLAAPAGWGATADRGEGLVLLSLSFPWKVNYKTTPRLDMVSLPKKPCLTSSLQTSLLELQILSSSINPDHGSACAPPRANVPTTEKGSDKLSLSRAHTC